MLKFLERFHQILARRIAVMTDRMEEDREWEYPPVVDATEDSGI